MPSAIVSTIAKYAALGFLVSTYKTLPFAYLVRFYYHVIHLFSHYPSFKRNNRTNTFGFTTPSTLFKWVGIDSYVSPLEVDMNIHKSNSSYFLDLDIARTKLVSQVFEKFLFNYYDNVHGEFKSSGIGNIPYIPPATVKCTFRRELKPFQRFRIESKVFAWDRKWLFVLSKFVSGKDGQKLHTVAVTKYVFKKGRITIPPEQIIKECGLWSEDAQKENEANYKLVQHLSDTDEIEKLL
ncbi:uncharacterized protein CANTADRAFT_21710 [Suhomyces tanzawaensis NRRL Y-17324]|uniref:Thioesterase/thiol ester dehydrase-isomerase n=1 Tax=Suhomyces tanzawaensis NRRL Y-17324 TaxID=984487 RepID=A0A1E4SHM2_9ASCO|nr:uncharacterized protein CANTADRAFT_21710 [Suhomyces tanzawaensis NRRL Y-17324]ODV78922.1 hypothetical protein CANTADRAFT_21710 [Suhomyces tanzawaensis NRRL Y-17324]